MAHSASWPVRVLIDEPDDLGPVAPSHGFSRPLKTMPQDSLGDGVIWLVEMDLHR
jgi:hypothetical protein